MIADRIVESSTPDRHEQASGCCLRQRATVMQRYPMLGLTAMTSDRSSVKPLADCFQPVYNQDSSDAAGLILVILDRECRYLSERE